jgi:DUF1680 family protein
MKIQRLTFSVIISLFLVSCSPKEPAGVPEKAPDPVRVSVSPYAQLVEVPIESVELTDGFWQERFELVKDVTIPKMFEYMHADTSSHYRNFLIAAGEMEGKWYGTFWHDGDFYKWLEALVYVYQVTNDPKLDSLMDRVIDVVAKAQEPDGYLSTYIQLNNKERFRNKQHHELYNLGHLMTVAARHYEATGKTNLLNVGIKTADYLYQTFAVNRPARLNPFDFNPSNMMGAVDMYRATGNEKYLALADTFVSMRGTTKRGVTITEEEFNEHSNPPGDDNNQDRVPFRKETKAVGHAVTATYLYAGAADLFLETGEKALMDAEKRIWEDVATRKLAVHGGAGPIPNGLSIRNDKVHEAFGDEYYLPLKVSYNETCANIGNVMWNWRLHKAEPDVKYLDIMETGMYNSGLSGFGLDGFSFYYNNPLRRYGKEAGLGGWNEAFQRSPHIHCYCCPPQLARHIAGFRHYIYATSKDKPGLWVNFFASSEVSTNLSDGTSVVLTQTTNYPWEGKVRLKLGLTSPAQFTVNIPVPGWATGAAVSVNGEKVKEVEAGKFLVLDREWKDQDEVMVELPMRIRLLKANPLVEQTRNQVAVTRGPVVYCLESADLPEGINFMDVVLNRTARYTAEFNPGLLGGVTVIKTTALALTDDEWSVQPYQSNDLYKETGNEKRQEIAIQLIPYYAWSNRGLSQMTIWMPVNY